MSLALTPAQQAQETEYSVPYHYVPNSSNNGFSQTLYWPWGMHYMAGLELVLSELQKLEFASLLDVGCGDGRFLREVSARFPKTNVLGIDYSKNAVALAKALNPSIDYACLDITFDPVSGSFDVVTMVEVLEHIPPQDVDKFLSGVGGALKANGRLILTVPHVNKRLQEKHYQHFSVYSLTEVLSGHFHVERIMPFDKLSRLTAWAAKLLGGAGNNFVITNRSANRLLYNRIVRHCLTPQPEDQCGRLLAIVRARG